jgi:hypothetical protein
MQSKCHCPVDVAFSFPCWPNFFGCDLGHTRLMAVGGPRSVSLLVVCDFHSPSEIPDEQQARRALRRFRSQVFLAVRGTMRRFGGYAINPDDATQEARLLVLSYAGIVHGRLHGRLAEWERLTLGDERRTKAMLGAQLHRDMHQIFGRRVDKGEAISLEALPVDDEPVHTPEDGWIAHIDAERYVRREYPCLAMLAYDELPEDIIARKRGRSLRTIQRLIANERERARTDPFFAPGPGMAPDSAQSHAMGPNPLAAADGINPRSRASQRPPATQVA